ncbi:ABC transporter substrate-binding protein [Argonema antarcticum]|uniref:ABC transporter substrate-binding protein n=1 Tax=Argonema antarcticum TaxID=2942763 RepID=UPI0020138E88|nr:ABC transporter substrate-binding protein [Argonema antarcticum]MCL1475071.1 ABC transporter substrate-binding protein [Argonema antarcticum A004/B2]
MSQKNETKILFLALLITLGLVGGGLWWFNGKYGFSDKEKTSQNLPANQSPQQRISFGNKTLMPGEVRPEKQAGIEAIANGNFSKAISNLETSLRANRNDPEALIFLNNARIGTQKNYTIGVSVPIGTDPNGASEILRGVAQAQNEINQAGGINGVKLKVAIANDDNNPETAKQVATELVKNQEILGVVGPYASDVTLAAGTVYQSGQLVAISPISTSVKLSNFSRYVFRTVPSDYIAARALADYMLTKLQQKNAAVFFNSQSSYSQSLKSEFVTAVSLGGGQVSAEFDLSSPDFSASKSVEEAIRRGAQVLMLAANTESLDKALQVVRVNRKRLKLLGGDDVYAPKTLEIGAEEALGMTLAVPWHIDADPKLSFSQQSRKLWGADVNWRTALAYDAVRSLIVALQRNPTRAGVQQALSSSDFSTTGASGTIRFLPSGDRNANIQLVQILPGNRSRTGYDFVPVPQQR